MSVLRDALGAEEARRFAERWLPAWSGNRSELLAALAARRSAKGGA
jgi:hypothetical protein